MSNSIGQRMKTNYEAPAKHFLTRRVPVVIRADGKAFHTYTKGFTKPFSYLLSEAMVRGAREAMAEMQGVVCAYIQSDEISFVLTDYETTETQPWFNYNKSKIETITASTVTAGFNMSVAHHTDVPAYFDARAFNIPREEVANYLIWRMQDWERNSLTMYCSEFFSHKQLHGKNKQDRHDMLRSIGKNWATDVPLQFKNGIIINSYGQAITAFDRRYDAIDTFLKINGL